MLELQFISELASVHWGSFARGWAYTPLGVTAPRYDQLIIHAGLLACIFDFRACISDKVKIHTDLRACVFDVVYFEMIRGFIFDIFGV